MYSFAGQPRCVRRRSDPVPGVDQPPRTVLARGDLRWDRGALAPAGLCSAAPGVRGFTTPHNGTSLGPTNRQLRKRKWLLKDASSGTRRTSRHGYAVSSSSPRASLRSISAGQRPSDTVSTGSPKGVWPQAGHPRTVVLAERWFRPPAVRPLPAPPGGLILGQWTACLPS